MNLPIENLLALEELASNVWSYRLAAASAMATTVGLFVLVTLAIGVAHRRRSMT